MSHFERGGDVGKEGRERKMHFIRIMTSLVSESIKIRLRELGWYVGDLHGTYTDFYWERDGEPKLPEDIAEKTRDGIEVG